VAVLELQGPGAAGGAREVHLAQETLAATLATAGAQRLEHNLELGLPPDALFPVYLKIKAESLGADPGQQAHAYSNAVNLPVRRRVLGHRRHQALRYSRFVHR